MLRISAAEKILVYHIFLYFCNRYLVAMSKKEKLIKRIKSLPKDFTFSELVTLLGMLGFSMSDKGRTSGSRVMFRNPKTDEKITIHKPHPASILKSKTLKDVVDILTDNKLI